ncbi:MAG: retroviral-like aspartic protease family protein [Sphingomonas sp.]
MTACAALLGLLAMQMSPDASAAPPPGLPPAALDDTLEIAGDPLAARMLATRMAVGVTVNGSGPYRFVVDSGADRTVVGAALAARLALPAAGTADLRDVGGASRVGVVRIATLRVGTSEVGGIIAPALPERFIGAHGLLGIDALAGQRLMFDFARRAITVEDARRPPEPVVAGEIVVTARRRKGQLILTQAEAAGTRIAAVIDTGAQMTMGNSALRARVLRGRKPPRAAPVTLVSVTGREVVADTMVLPELRIGGVTLRDVTIAFTDAPPFALFGLADAPAVLLGTDVLEAFARVSLDFRRRKVRFVLRR